MYTQVTPQVVIVRKEYDRLNSELGELRKNPPEFVQLTPEDQITKSTLESKLTELTFYESDCSELVTAQQTALDIQTELKVHQERIDRQIEYTKMTSRTGDIYHQVLMKLADAFSEDFIEYRVHRGVSRNIPYLTFESYYNVKGKYRAYGALSDGQKTVSDLDFLSKLFSMQVGLLVLDEHLKHLDDFNLPKASEIITNMNVNTILISTHDSNYTQYTKKMNLELDENGRTRVQAD